MRLTDGGSRMMDESDAGQQLTEHSKKALVFFLVLSCDGNEIRDKPMRVVLLRFSGED